MQISPFDAAHPYAYGANIGWISLANAQAFVRTETLEPGPDSDGDGIPGAWELAWTSSVDFRGVTESRHLEYPDTHPIVTTWG